MIPDKVFLVSLISERTLTDSHPHMWVVATDQWQDSFPHQLDVELDRFVEGLPLIPSLVCERDYSMEGPCQF